MRLILQRQEPFKIRMQLHVPHPISFPYKALAPKRHIWHAAGYIRWEKPKLAPASGSSLPASLPSHDLLDIESIQVSYASSYPEKIGHWRTALGDGYLDEVIAYMD